jgi:hypothetical protein
MKSPSIFDATLVQSLEQLLFCPVNDVFGLSYTQVKLFCKPLKRDTVYQSAFKQLAISERMDVFSDQVTDLAVCVLPHLPPPQSFG